MLNSAEQKRARLGKVRDDLSLFTLQEMEINRPCWNKKVDKNITFYN